MNDLCIGQLARIVGGELSLGAMPPLGGELEPIGRVVIDSRQAGPGTIFWGLAGRTHDGSHFAEDAFRRGADGAVVSGRDVVPWAGKFSIRVPDTQLALWELAGWLRSRFEGRVIAVTGSVGKTTARQMIDTVLRARFCGSASPQNYNNFLGVPLSMLGMHDDHDYSVLELGASGAGEIEALARLARPHVGVITKIGDAHLGRFGGVAEIAAAKGELLDALARDGAVVLSGDDPWLRRMAGRSAAKVIWVGRKAGCDVMAEDIQSRGGELSFTVDGTVYRVPVWGRHQLTPALTAIAVGRLMGIPPRDMAAALGRYESAPMRCQVTRSGGVTVINDCYNASPSAMRAALELVREIEVPGRRIVVLGEMAELGDAAPELHRLLGRQVVGICGADRLVACGRFADEMVAGAHQAGMPAAALAACATPEAAVPVVTDQVSPGDAVLVKGCRAMEMEHVVDALLGRQAAAA